MTKEFTPDWKHGHTTRDGREAEIIKTGMISDWPNVAIVTMQDGSERVLSCTDSGYVLSKAEQSQEDLINKPAPKKRVRGWIMRGKKDGALWFCLAGYGSYRRNVSSKVAYIDIEEGEGL